MAEFVLVPGAWLGAWAWDEVAAELRAAGHGVHPLTLSGLAEKRDVPAGQRTHVQDVVGEVERLDLRDVVLVGHSYSGIPVGQAAALIGDRLARLVLVDAEVPVEGGSFASGWWEGQAKFEAILAGGDGFWQPPAVDEFEGQGLTDEQTARLVAGATPHPAATLTEPATPARPLSDLPATYIKCLLDGPEPNSDVAALLAGEKWRLVEMNTGHWPMFSEPRPLAALLASEAA
ncbi:Pimeloyl-ACP methyl ester carboxylesterase [Actinacidiphila alni]|uniref:Pimeloyl-ACP methyl ester carboxylesterase n=1 Tax=Actinacidiphila alni TaxID=380248 RepID=A0A1I2LYM6_9ACTN|nr:alpha/beta hydrolase [Actinacidiphila alni]SFF83599.1 Pimeloyl-ACP methyl ester carboxylesterase [Actinacidiphila alni]